MAKRRFRSRGRFTRLRRRRGRSSRLKKFVKRVVRRMSEVKYAISNGSGTFDAGNDYAANITPTIAVGPGKDERIGWKVRYKYLQFRLWLLAYEGSTGGEAAIVTRVILWQPRLPVANGTNPHDMPLFNLTGNTYAQVSPINNNAARIIMDKTIAMGVRPLASDVMLPAVRIFKKKIRINNNVNFQNATTTQPGDPKDNYFLTIVTGFGATNLVTFQSIWSCRVSYIDV